VEANLDASLGTAPSTLAASAATAPMADHHEHGHNGHHGLGAVDTHLIPADAAASIVADFHHGKGNLDLSALGQAPADHHQGHGGEHHAASMPMPAAIALMHEEAIRAAHAVAHH
jgi:hypothetical protein